VLEAESGCNRSGPFGGYGPPPPVTAAGETHPEEHVRPAHAALIPCMPCLWLDIFRGSPRPPARLPSDRSAAWAGRWRPKRGPSS
jgi:hypothetical protein